MVFTVVLAFVWLFSFFLHTVATDLTISGLAVWLAPTGNTVVAECYPLSVQFTSPVAAHNVSFFYYVGKQGYPGQTIVQIASWPESTWVDANTVYTAFSPSVPIAAGAMIALVVYGYDNSSSFLNEIVIQPNSDSSCITAASQFGISTYDGFAAQPASTTVSPTASSSTAGAAAVTSPLTTPTPTASTSLTTHTSTSTSSKHPSSALIVGAIIAAVVGLLLTTAAAVWFARRYNRLKIYETRRLATYNAQPYDVPPPPIQEVDAGSLVFGQPERLPPQYDDISGSSSSGANSGTDRGKGRNILFVR